MLYFAKLQAKSHKEIAILQPKPGPYLKRLKLRKCCANKFADVFD